VLTPEHHLNADRALGVSPAAMTKARQLADFYVSGRGVVIYLRGALISNASVSLAMPPEHVRGQS